MEERTFSRAMQLLKSRQSLRSSKPPSSTLPVKRFPNGSPTFQGTPHIQGMKKWLGQLGHTDERLRRLKVIHVAGTKGKGSTCAYIDSLLGSYGRRTGFPLKRGLYTSPSLMNYNDMIRINFQPLSEACFTKAFFEVWDGLRLDEKDKKPPRKLQLLAIMSFHVFLQAEVDVAIYETHHGGEFDVTNIIDDPVVTAITTIGLDHKEELGGTYESIAWHKGGIFKKGACALSVVQNPRAAGILDARARELGLALGYVEALQELPGKFQDDAQRINASLALRASDAFLNHHTPGSHLSPEDVEDGLRNFRWPGRFHIVEEDTTTWCTDGAHNPMSAEIAAKWFRRLDKPQSAKNVLVFGLDSDRHDPYNTLETLATLLSEHVEGIVLTSDTGNSDNKRLATYSEIWRSHARDVKIKIADREQAMDCAREMGTQVFVTGSLFLVAFVLQKLNQSCT
ncbi:hypothetical protein FPOA_13418 [Fusarium poae]|uniref:tetrahydrofolate synthase n=1 Tax=Fusarium poae TaxID=36050 RepID=A0A1B8A5P6_FUSPO|nr:hypothetical protein FPOA_13418 [Fusarium poae]